MLVSLKEILALAQEENCAVGAFNTPNLECVRAVTAVTAALDFLILGPYNERKKEVDSPCIPS